MAIRAAYADHAVAAALAAVDARVHAAAPRVWPDPSGPAPLLVQTACLPLAGHEHLWQT